MDELLERIASGTTTEADACTVAGLAQGLADAKRQIAERDEVLVAIWRAVRAGDGQAVAEIVQGYEPPV
jgi:hypothetical protein